MTHVKAVRGIVGHHRPTEIQLPFNEKWADLSDITPRELASLLPLVAVMIWFGINPKWPLDLMNATVVHMLGK